MFVLVWDKYKVPTQDEPNIAVWSIKFFNQRILPALVGMDKAQWFNLWRFLKLLIKMLIKFWFETHLWHKVEKI